MLLQLSKKISACYERAGVCRMNAERASDDEELRAAFQRIEASWIRLAQSFEHAERVDTFLNAAQPHIGPLVVRCPLTGDELETGIETSDETLAATSSKSVRVRCEHCGGEHPIPMRDGYIRRP